MKALIATNEIVYLSDGTTGMRVAQVEPDDKIFPVAPELFWMDCDSNVIADQYYFDGTEIKLKPTENV